MKPRAVVRAIRPDKRRNHRADVSFLPPADTIDHLDRPTLFHVLEEVEAIALMVGEEAVEFAVGVDVDEAEACVAPFLIYECNALGTVKLVFLRVALQSI